MFPYLAYLGIGLGGALLARGVRGCSYAKSSNLHQPHRVKITYYWIHPTVSGDVPIVSRSGATLALVSMDSYKNMVLEGTGRLPDGRLANFSGEVFAHPQFGNLYKFSIVKNATGHGGKSLIPFKSIAVDPTVFALGSTIYIPEFNSQFSADDTGSGIKGDHIDMFIGEESNLSKVNHLPGEAWAVEV
jgi:hypothetical protein